MEEGDLQRTEVALREHRYARLKETEGAKQLNAQHRLLEQHKQGTAVHNYILQILARFVLCHEHTDTDMHT